MHRPGGYALVVSPEAGTARLDRFRCEEIGAGTFEADTFTCVHCNCVVHVKVGTQGDEYFCRNCMARICPPCADHPCIPFLKKIEAMEARQRARQSYGSL